MSTWAEKEASIRALERNGKVDPNDLIEAAKSPKHPCHDSFTWDVNQAAAERWRDQARELIRRVTFEVKVEEITMSVVNYIPNDGEEHQFQSLPKIRNKLTAQSAFVVELRMLHGLTNRVYGIAVAKAGMLGEEAVGTLSAVRRMVAELLAEFSPEEDEE